MDKRPEYWISRKQQLMNIIEGVPIRMAMLNITCYSEKVLYALANTKNEELMLRYVKADPEILNNDMDKFVDVLYSNNVLKREEYKIAKRDIVLGIRLTSAPINQVLVPIHEAFTRALIRIHEEKRAERLKE